MYSIERYYDHFVIIENGNVLVHCDTEVEAERELLELEGEKVKTVGRVNIQSLRYNNYHKHTMYSNLRTLDCVSKPIDYINRAKVKLRTTSSFGGGKS